MNTITKEITLSKETYELGQGVGEFIKAVKKSLADGFQYGDDLPDIIDSAIRDLLPAINGATSISDEIAENPKIFAETVALIGGEIISEFI